MISIKELPAIDSADRDLETRLRIFLAARHPELARLRVSADHGTISLCGVVKSFHVRQLALSIASHVAGVRQIVDDIEVPNSP